MVSGDTTAVLAYDAHPIYVGADSDKGQMVAGFYGDLDEVAIWPSARTPEQIKADVQACSPASVADRIGSWNFDEPTGQPVLDASPNANNGYFGAMQTVADAADPVRVFSTVPWGGDYTLPAGGVSPTSACSKPRNKALHFGGGPYAQAMDSPSLRPQDFTVESWVRFSSLANYQTFFDKPSGSTQSTIAMYYLGGALRASLDPNPNIVYTWTPILGRWYHVAFSYDHALTTGNMKLYVDDNQVATGTAVTPPAYDTSPVRVGTYMDGNGPFFGDLDEVMLWNTPRTLTQIIADMHACTPASLDGLAAYWSFDEGTGQIAADATSNRNNLQLGSAVTPDSRDPFWAVSAVPF
jgi:hypothetical protein